MPRSIRACVACGEDAEGIVDGSAICNGGRLYVPGPFGIQ